ncbi:hypothetical protein BE20_30655 [Sorangium cellulosum]|nr:hypothetical protein BE20_30655 [Sorangium cellulosum]
MTTAVDVLTGTDAALGSALYMSPEQMRQTRSVDHRTDIYALGVSLYELLAGRQPYYAETLPQLCSEVLTGTPTPLRDLRPDVPAPLATVLEKAYARDREQRYASVAELVVALAPFAPARTYPTLVRVARMGGLSLHAAAAGGHRASQPSFSSVDPRASAPALREPSWPGLPSPGVAGHADAAPSPRNGTLPGAGSPLSRPPPVAHPAPAVAVLPAAVAGRFSRTRSRRSPGRRRRACRRATVGRARRPPATAAGRARCRRTASRRISRSSPARTARR